LSKARKVAAIDKAAMYEASKRLLKIYLDSRWVSFAIAICLLAVTVFSLVWAIGCFPLPWVFPVRLLDQLLNFLLFPLLLLSLAAVAGILVVAIYQALRGKGLVPFFLFLFSLFMVITGAGALFFVTLAGPALCSNTPKNRAYAVAVAQKWAGLAPLPTSARDVVVEVEGSAFTREVTLTFEAEPEEIETWLEVSPGTTDVVPKELIGGSLEYSISPKGGAAFAQITLSSDRRRVRIVAYWS